MSRSIRSYILSDSICNQCDYTGFSPIYYDNEYDYAFKKT